MPISPERQKERLGEKFERLRNSFDNLHISPEGIEPEQVIVFEVAGAVVDRLSWAAEAIEGLEWLSEYDLEDMEPDNDFKWDAEDEEDGAIKQRLYAVMSNQRAMQTLINAWDDWAAHPDARAKKRFGPFKSLFRYLKDVRKWGVKDRLEEGRIIEYWKERLELRTDNIRFEVDLWFRGSVEQQQIAYNNLERLIQAEGGRCITQSVISDILYHGVLAELPSSKIAQFIDRIFEENGPLLFKCEDVMLFRPHAQINFDNVIGTPEERIILNSELITANQGGPIIGVLDGYPILNHVVLSGKTVLDDPEGMVNKYRPEQMKHGTAMLSLIINGDLSSPEAQLRRPVYIRPILQPDSTTNREVTSDDQLLIDIIHAAVKRIKVGDGALEAIAPTVQVINLSLGNSDQPFDTSISPLAKLLDWLSWTYNVLFIVSAGNQAQNIKLDNTRFNLADPEERRKATLSALLDDQRNRRIFSPAESVNSLTVGAIHSDKSIPRVIGSRIDLLTHAVLPSPLCSICSGYRRSVKPEIFLPGGRQLYQELMGTGLSGTYEVVNSNSAPGTKVAAPGSNPMQLDDVVFSCGTSNAAALASRSAGLLSEKLEELASEPGGDRLSSDYLPVLLKTLLIHGASWGEAEEILHNLFNSGRTAHELQRLKSHFLGFGQVSVDRAMKCENNRVTVLGWNKIADKEGHLYRLPLPPSLSGRSEKKRLIITLSWLTPVNPRHNEYRRAGLWFHLENQEKSKLGFQNAAEVYNSSSQRGSVHHQIYESERPTPFDDGDEIVFSVNCMKRAGELDHSIPYSLALTLEVAASIDIYQEVQQIIRPSVSVRPGSNIE